MKFAIFFIAIMVLDIILYMFMVGIVGFWLALLIAIGTSVVGIILLRSQGRRSFERVIEAVSDGGNVPAAMINGARMLIAGLLLVIPGLFTDLVGLIFLLPAAGMMIFFLVGNRMMQATAQARVNRTRVWGNSSTVIDADSQIVEDGDSPRETERLSD